jgi:ribose transport system permease protein
MNLSVGAIGGLVAIVTGGLMDRLGLPPAVAILVGLLAGALCGLFNGWAIVRLGVSGVSAFLVTLATGSLFTGINLGITKAQPYYNLPDSFKAIGAGRLLGVPYITLVMLTVAVAMGVLFYSLGLGRQILAIGGNIRAAELSGVPVERVTILTHILSGLLAAIAAVLLAARLGSGQPDVGTDWMLPSFAAPIIGGTRLSGGQVSVPGAVLGAVLLALISNGLVFLNVDVYYTRLVQGAIILAAAAVDRVRTLGAERLEQQGQ